LLVVLLTTPQGVSHDLLSLSQRAGVAPTRFVLVVLLHAGRARTFPQHQQVWPARAGQLQHVATAPRIPNARDSRLTGEARGPGRPRPTQAEPLAPGRRNIRAARCCGVAGGLMA